MIKSKLTDNGIMFAVGLKTVQFWKVEKPTCQVDVYLCETEFDFFIFYLFSSRIVLTIKNVDALSIKKIMATLENFPIKKKLNIIVYTQGGRIKSSFKKFIFFCCLLSIKFSSW